MEGEVQQVLQPLNMDQHFAQDSNLRSLPSFFSLLGEMETSLGYRHCLLSRGGYAASAL